MSVLAYATGRVDFQPKRGGRDVTYSDRTIVEIREEGFPNFIIRAVDTANNRRIIFSEKIEKNNRYKKSGSENVPDRLTTNEGVYEMHLKGEARTAFHASLDGILEMMGSSSSNESDDDTSSENDSILSEDAYQRLIYREEERPARSKNTPNLSTKPMPVQPKEAPRKIFIQINQLIKAINEGNINVASQLAGQLAAQPLFFQPSENTRNLQEESFRIKIQLDGNRHVVDEKCEEVQLDVFPSTNFKEIRGFIESVYKFPAHNIYLFANGQLAPDNSSMENLRMGSDSLIIAFVLTP